MGILESKHNQIYPKVNKHTFNKDYYKNENNTFTPSTSQQMEYMIKHELTRLNILSNNKKRRLFAFELLFGEENFKKQIKRCVKWIEIINIQTTHENIKNRKLRVSKYIIIY